MQEKMKCEWEWGNEWDVECMQEMAAEPISNILRHKIHTSADTRRQNKKTWTVWPGFLIETQ
jgi:hypothetical protein